MYIEILCSDYLYCAYRSIFGASLGTKREYVAVIVSVQMFRTPNLPLKLPDPSQLRFCKPCAGRVIVIDRDRTAKYVREIGMVR